MLNYQIKINKIKYNFLKSKLLVKTKSNILMNISMRLITLKT